MTKRITTYGTVTGSRVEVLNHLFVRDKFLNSLSDKRKIHLAGRLAAIDNKLIYGASFKGENRVKLLLSATVSAKDEVRIRKEAHRVIRNSIPFHK